MTARALFTQLASRPPLSRLHPRVAEFLLDYLSGEKAVRFGEQWVINTQFPPVPSRAFDNMVQHFLSPASDRLYSVTLAVTNRCSFRCRHCYNAGRSRHDLPADTVRLLVGELQDRGAALITLTGGEPLMRDDLERIAQAIDSRSTVIVGTTGEGLTPDRAGTLRRAGVFGVGISLDSAEPAEHDRRRGRAGAFDIAIAALDTARAAGLYPYVVTVADRELLERERFMRFLAFAKSVGALEVHLLEPSATGRLAGHDEVTLDGSHRRAIIDYQREVARRDDLPILSTFTYLESAESFGCGAGLTHIYIDGSGELCPCNLVPLSFGNVSREGLDAALTRMRRHFAAARPGCVGQLLCRHVPPDASLPLPPDASDEVCRRHLPREHALPRFFRVRQESQLSDLDGAAATAALRDAYDHVHEDYDEFWTLEARKPVEDLVARLRLRGGERIFEAGCGSGVGTVLLAERLAAADTPGELTAVDLSSGMLLEAGRRLASRLGPHAPVLKLVRLRQGDALAELQQARDLDLVFTTWVLGYIPLAPFFAGAARAMRPGGRLALVVHRENSPAEALEIFAELVAADPSALTRPVAFDFPAGADDMRDRLARCGLSGEVWEGSITFRYPTPERVLEHLLRSGAGTVFYEAIALERREALAQAFVEAVRRRHADGRFDVTHDYVAAIAGKG